jgi:transcription elongation GreA/GreB family factor
MKISMPSQVNLDTDRVSIALPVSLASVGQTMGKIISWNTPGGIPKMKIIQTLKMTKLRPFLKSSFVYGE